MHLCARVIAERGGGQQGPCQAMGSQGLPRNVPPRDALTDKDG